MFVYPLHSYHYLHHTPPKANTTETIKAIEEGEAMDLESVKKLLENDTPFSSSTDTLPRNLITLNTMYGVKVNVIKPGHILCSMKITQRIGNVLNSGVIGMLVDIIGSAPILTFEGTKTTGVSVEISVSNVDVARVGDEIEIEARSLRTGKMVAMVSVEVREKGSGRVIAQGRHTKFLGVSKM